MWHMHSVNIESWNPKVAINGQNRIYLFIYFRQYQVQNTTKKLFLVTFKIQLIHHIQKGAVHSSFWCKKQLQELSMLEEVGTTYT